MQQQETTTNILRSTLHLFCWLVCLLFHLNASSQDKPQKFFGLDLNLDWYTLTNQSRVAYDLGEQNTNTDLVYVSCNFHLDGVDIILESFGFHANILGFEKGYSDDFNKLKPSQYWGEIRYSDSNVFDTEAFHDAEEIRYNIVSTYGKPDENYLEDHIRSYYWKKSNFTIRLYANEETLTTSLIIDVDR